MKMLLDAIDHRVAFSSTEATRKKFHDSRIGIHCRRRVAIFVAPLTQADAAAGQCHRGASDI
jgi:hypothetical protein